MPKGPSDHAGTASQENRQARLMDQAEDESRQAEAGRSGEKSEERGFQAMESEPQSPQEQRAESQTYSDRKGSAEDRANHRHQSRHETASIAGASPGAVLYTATTRGMIGLYEDLRYGLRGLARNRSFTAVCVLSLALGIGANTTIFTLVNALLLRPL